MGCEGAAGRDESSLPIVVIDVDRRRVTVAATENRIFGNKSESGTKIDRESASCCAFMGRPLIAIAFELEVAQVLADLKSTGSDGVCNGYLLERSVTTVIGDVEVEVPRIRSRDGNRPINFSSKLC